MAEISKPILTELVFRAYVDLAARRRSRASTPNVLLQEFKSLHENTTFSDLSKDFKDDIRDVANAISSYLNREGVNLTSNN